MLCLVLFLAYLQNLETLGLLLENNMRLLTIN